MSTTLELAECRKQRNEPAYRAFARGATFAECGRMMGVTSAQAGYIMRRYAADSPTVPRPFRHHFVEALTPAGVRYHVTMRLISERLAQACSRGRDRYAKALK